MSNSLPTVSIIIPTYNEAASIVGCLESCTMQDDLADEILVIDNNSQDETADLVKDCIKRFPDANIRLIHESEQGLLPARDRGFREAKSDVYGRIDADTKLEQGWVRAVRRIFSDPDVAAATGPALYHDMPLRVLAGRVDDKIRSALHNMEKDFKFLFGSNMAIRDTTWEKVKDHIPVDHEDKLHEDINMALTICEQDLKIVYDQEMAAGMSARRLEDSPKDYYQYCMRFERTFKAHGLKDPAARWPIFIYLIVYFPTRTVRKFYDGETNRFTLKKLREDIETIRARNEA